MDWIEIISESRRNEPNVFIEVKLKKNLFTSGLNRFKTIRKSEFKIVL